MKIHLLLSAFVMLPLHIRAQNVAINKIMEYGYDKNGNVTSRVVTIPKGVWDKEFPKIDISDSIIIVKDRDRITVDLHKDYSNPAVLKVSDTTPVIVKSDEFNSRTYSFDISGYHPGVYVINVKVGDSEGTKTFSK